MTSIDDVGALFWRALREASEEARRGLVEVMARSPDEVLEAIRRRIEGGVAPDTVAVSRAVEVVLAALALRSSIRLVIPVSPVPGWASLLSLVDLLGELGLGQVYRVPFWPGAKISAIRGVRSIARLFKGISVGVVDVTDASPLVVAAAYPGGARWLTVLIDRGHVAVFDRFWFTR